MRSARPHSPGFCYVCVVFVAPVDSLSCIVVQSEEELQATSGLAVFAVEVVTGGVLSECLNACVRLPVHSGEKWQGEERGYYFCREAGRQTPHSSLLISSRWPKFELLCSSPPLPISLHSWDGRHGDHS